MTTPELGQLPAGWYRVTSKGWVQVPDADAELEQMTGGGFDLVEVAFTFEDVPLW